MVISADSRQVYRYLDIGTSKTTAAEMRGIRHEMLDVTEPVRKLELEEYVRLASAHVADCHARGAVPFVVGGTGVYVRALLEGWAVDRVGAARAALRRTSRAPCAPTRTRCCAASTRAPRPAYTRTTTTRSSTRSRR